MTLPDGSTIIEPVLGERNSDRFPTYVRFDFKSSRSFTLPRGQLRLELEVVNLTDRKNVCCVDEFVFEQRADGTIDANREVSYWLGFTPSFSMQWEF